MRSSASSARHHVSAQWLQRHWIFEKRKPRRPRALRRNRLPRRWQVNALSPDVSGQTVEPVVGTLGRGLPSRVRLGLPNASCLQRFWGVLFLSEGPSLDVEWESWPLMNHGDGERPSLPHFLPLESISFANGSGFESILCPPWWGQMEGPAGSPISLQLGPRIFV